MEYEVTEIKTGARMSHRSRRPEDIMGTTLFDRELYT